MRKAILILSIILFVGGCQLLEIDLSLYPMPHYDIDVTEIEYAISGYDECDRTLEIWVILINRWVKNNITYIADNNDSWQTPIETFNRGGGDCEDFAILFLWLYYQYTGEKNIEMRSLKVSDNHGHIVVFWNNEYYLETGNELIENSNYVIHEIYDFDTAIKTAEYIK